MHICHNDKIIVLLVIYPCLVLCLDGFFSDGDEKISFEILEENDK